VSLFKKDNFSRETYVSCPECGFECVHPSKIEDHPADLLAGVDRVIKVFFYGECGHTFFLQFTEHKGTTFVECGYDLAKPDTEEWLNGPGHQKSYSIAKDHVEPPPLINISEKLASRIISLLGKVPKKELGGLKNQIERACTSIPLNLSEGEGRKCGTKGIADRLRFFRIALGSAKELMSQLRIIRTTVSLTYASEVNSALELTYLVVETISTEITQEESDV
jgi:four helix bundle protein